MEDNSKLRIKSAMVVYEFERALGRYVRERNSDIATSTTARDIIERSGISSGKDGKEVARAIIENSFLSEALSLAVLASSGTTDHAHFETLRRLFDALGLPEIRNAISHPNRPFPECYWYRCATIASDPSIDALHFIEVAGAFQNALDENLQEPPEEWLNKKKWMVPAGIPDEFEHSITGLHGRAKDIAKLNRELKSPRSNLIAIVARGGIGKTSLALQVLSDFCLAADAPTYSDGVACVSLKQDALTIDGVIALDAPSTIIEIRNNLRDEINELLGADCETFEEATNEFAQKRLWLFVDNLETILRDSPTDFTDFNDSLPAAWRVIVTSRIPVEGAKNLPLDALEDQGAFALARTYFQSKGHTVSDPELIERIIKGCKNNPLAIRLAIELYLAGHDISDALQLTNEEITNFSFSTLLDFLRRSSVQVLEAIFALEAPNRADLCDSLELNVDEISLAIAELTRTSLITRKGSDRGEIYELGASIRDLLRSNPRDLGVRGAVYGWLKRSRTTEQETLKNQKERQVSKLDIFYIPEGSSAAQINLAKEVQRAAKQNNFTALTALEVKIRQQLENANSSFLRRLYARVLNDLNDFSMAERQYELACQLDPDDPAPKFALAIMFLKMERATEAADYARSLIEAGWGDARIGGNFNSNRLWSIFLTSLNYQEQFDEVFTATQEWKTKGELAATFGLSRASAYRRLADKEQRKGVANPDRVGKLLTDSFEAISHVLKNYGSSHLQLKGELAKLFSEVGYFLRKIEIPEKWRTALFKHINDAQTALLQVCQIQQKDFREIVVRLGVGLNAADGEVASPALEEDRIKRELQLATEGFTIVKVKRLPKHDSFPTYVFAEDNQGQSYFVHVDNFEGGNWRRWVFLEHRSTLAIKHEANVNRSGRRAVEAIYVG